MKRPKIDNVDIHFFADRLNWKPYDSRLYNFFAIVSKLEIVEGEKNIWTINGSI